MSNPQDKHLERARGYERHPYWCKWHDLRCDRNGEQRCSCGFEELCMHLAEQFREVEREAERQVEERVREIVRAGDALRYRARHASYCALNRCTCGMEVRLATWDAKTEGIER